MAAVDTVTTASGVKVSKAVLEKDFTWSETDEPHRSRRQAILKAHPEMKALFVKEPKTFLIVAFILVTQTALAYGLRDASWPWIFFFAYLYGGTVNHTQQLAAHELSHNLCWDAPWANKLTGILANLSTTIPSSISFQKYHMEHHQFQGVDGVDTDVPTMWEVRTFVGPVLKFIWLIGQPVAYALRPLFVKPKKMGMWELINVAACVAFDVAVFLAWGHRALLYLTIGSLLGLGVHPVAGHFVAEHYEFTKGFETYSYYGPLNYLNFNVGYHNEHHDFPRIPWSQLPKVRTIAPEFYDYLPYYTSYCSVLYNYVMDSTMGPQARVKRTKSSRSKDKMN